MWLRCLHSFTAMSDKKKISINDTEHFFYKASVIIFYGNSKLGIMLSHAVVGIVIVLAISYYVYSFHQIENQRLKKKKMERAMQHFFRDRTVAPKLHMMVLTDDGTVQQNTLNKHTVGLQRLDKMKHIIENGLSGGAFDTVHHVNLQGKLEHHLSFCQRNGSETIVLLDKL